MRGLTRRDFIRGLGVSAATIQFLPQIIYRPLWAQGNPPPACRLFATIGVGHGGDLGQIGVTDANAKARYPTTAAFNIISGYSVAADPLQNFVKADGSLSSVIGPEWKNSGCLSYLNIAQGLDIFHYFGHGTNSSFANARPDISNTMPPWRSLDQVVYQSSGYSNATNPSKFLCFQGYRISTGGVEASNIHSNLVENASVGSLQAAFAQLFSTPSAAQKPSSQAAIDQVLIDLSNLTKKPYISAQDKEAIQIHEQRLRDLRNVISASSCGVYSSQPPANPTPLELATYMATMLAFAVSSCDRPLVYTTTAGGFAPENLYSTGDFHSDEMHNASKPGNPLSSRQQQLNSAIVPYHRDALYRSFFLLANALKSTPNGSGGNLLDDSLLCYTPEHGEYTHWNNSLKMLTAGKARGRLKKTGQLINFAHTTTTRYIDDPAYASDPLRPQITRYMGLPYGVWLTNIAEIAGVLPSEYETSSGQGFGYYNYPDIKQEAGQRTAIPPNLSLNWLKT